MPSSSRAARVASCKWPPPLASSRSPSTTSCASIQRPAAISEAARDSNSPSGRGGAAPSVCSASSATRVASGCPISGRRAAARGGEDTPPPPRSASRSDPPPPASACLSLARSASSRPSASSAAPERPGMLGEILRLTSPPSERHLGSEARRSGTRAGGQPTSPAAGPANQPTSSIKTARRDPANRSGWQILAGWPHAGRPASTRRKCAARQAAPTCPRPSCTPNGPASSSGPPPIRRARTPSSAPAPRIPAC
mmetsp:Transcript_9157/g.29302  ORF Transcript_9157/g.29302 Transcript_9157/m.29302 type:complete len:253 (-) Transcript_9157:182-940(-)